MKLLRQDGTEIIPSAGKHSKATIVTGKNKNKVVNVREIIEPCERYPEGLVIVDRDASGGLLSWQQYYPFVIGASFVEDTGVNAAEVTPSKTEGAEAEVETSGIEPGELKHFEEKPELIGVDIASGEDKTVEMTIPANADLSLPPAEFLGTEEADEQAHY